MMTGTEKIRTKDTIAKANVKLKIAGRGGITIISAVMRIWPRVYNSASGRLSSGNLI
jgi:hypothetical protein